MADSIFSIIFQKCPQVGLTRRYHIW